MSGHFLEISADRCGLQRHLHGNFHDNGNIPDNAEGFGETDAGPLLDGEFEIEHLVDRDVEFDRHVDLLFEPEFDRHLALDLQGVGERNFNFLIHGHVSFDVEQGDDRVGHAPTHGLLDVNVGFDPDVGLLW
ncbi:MAG: hypothetical protein ACK55I_05025, partial [bacterium]